MSTISKAVEEHQNTCDPKDMLSPAGKADLIRILTAALEPKWESGPVPENGPVEPPSDPPKKSKREELLDQVLGTLKQCGPLETKVSKCFSLLIDAIPSKHAEGM